MRKVLFVAAHRQNRSPSQRFRFEQYFDYLEKNGYRCHLSYLISDEDDQYFYSPGSYLRKSYIFLKSLIKRSADVIRASGYDIIFIQREAFMTGSILFEKLFKRSGAKVIFDFDDSIWLNDVSEANRKFAWLKDPAKTARIISLSDMVIAGNQYLADYARKHTANVKVLPTTIDTDEYIKAENPDKGKTLCIGWSGSITTIKHFEYAIPILEKIKEKYGKTIEFKVIGDGSYENEKLGIKGLPWKKEEEIRELSSFDIGIMPLPDDEWAMGKCGLKGLQYMALGVPAVMSPVGVNTNIIKEGKNGFLAGTADEWLEKLSLLIESEELRESIGKEGRQTVIENYSVESQKEKYLNCLNEFFTLSS